MMLAGLADQPSKIERLFSKNFMACLLNQAATEDRYLHRAAVKALKALEATVSQKPQILAPVLRNILGNNGAYSFDQRTNTKTADKLFHNINKENEKDIIKIIQTPLGTLAQRESADGQNTLRTYADYLSKVLNASARTDGEKKGANTSAAFAFALQELGKLAYSQPQEIPAALLTEQIRGLCRSRLETSFAKLLRSSDDFGIFCRAIAAIDATAIAADDQIKDAMKQALAQMNKLQKSKGKSEVEKSLTQGLALLHAVSIFQLYNEDPDAMEVLQDLAQFSERMGSSKTKGDQETAGSSELLVEILLSMVARPSSLMRQVSQQVFEAFTSQISAEGLELLIAPLASGESAKGQQELFHTEEEDEMNIDENEDESASDVEDVDEASDLELDSDVEFVGMAEDGEEEDDDSDSDDDDDESEGNEDNKKSAGKQEPVDLNELIGDILKSHALDKDKDAASSEDDMDMSDSEMLALDAKLVDVLRPHVKPSVDSKKKKKDAKQSVINFKYRVLDLLDIYVKNEALNPLGLDLLAPLLRLMRTTSAKPLARQACEIILNYQKALKKARSNKEAVKGSSVSEDLLPVLAEIHDEASKDQSHAYAKAASAASLVVASLMFAVDRTSITQVVVVYAKTQSEWVLGNAKLQASFFTEWNNWCQNQASQAA
jgi:DNA polymerase phi